MKTSVILVCCASLVTVAGCISSVIISGGKPYQHLQDAGVTEDEVRACLGVPVWSQKHVPAVPVLVTPEYRAWSVATNRPPLPCVRYYFDKQAALCEVYRIQGPLADKKRAEVYVMMLGATFFAAEILDPFLIPHAVMWQNEHARDVSWLTFWFDRDGTCSGYYVGDIRETLIGFQGFP